MLIDAQDAGARSCGVTFLLRGNYQRAFDFLRLDAASEVSRAVSVDVLLRQRKEKEALEMLRNAAPGWGGYGLLLAFLELRPASEIAALGRRIEPAPDPEVNYFSAAHLAYAGQTDAALTMLKKTIEGGYCAYPAVDSDPVFASLRGRPEFKKIRAAGIECQNSFLAQRR